MNRKRIVSTLLTASLVLGSSVPAFAANKPQNISNTNTIVNINKVKQHKTKEAPSPSQLKKKLSDINGIKLSADDDSDDYNWTKNTESSGGVTSTHFEEGTASVICAALAAKFGGTYGEWYAMACGIAGWAATESSVDTWEKVDYYWTPNPDYTSEFPYYIKQVTTSYSDPDCKNYVDTSVRYYYSDLTI